MCKAMLDNINSGFAFRDWSYVTALITLSPHAMPLQSDLAILYCLDTSCGVTFVNRKWLYKYAPEENILKMAVFSKVRSIKSSKHESDKFLSMPIYFLRIDKQKQLVYTCIYYNMHLVDGLKANMLIRNNIIMLKGIMIDLANFIVIISSCNI